MPKNKVCIPVDTGGHLTEVLSIIEAFDKADIFFVTVDSARTRELPYRVYRLRSYSGKFWMLRFLRIIPDIIKIMINERPDIVFSTGAEIAVPFFYLAKAIGAKTVFLESITRITMPTLTGKFVYPICDLFLVQHRQLMSRYGSKAKYEGRVI